MVCLPDQGVSSEYRSVIPMIYYNKLDYNIQRMNELRSQFASSHLSSSPLSRAWFSIVMKLLHVLFLTLWSFVVNLPKASASIERYLRSQQDAPFDALKGHPFMRRNAGINATMELHPMYRMEPAEDEEDSEDDQSERNLEVQSQFTPRSIAVKPSEYDVSYQQYSNIQYGATPIYKPDNMNVQIGTWYWEWIDDSYGTMMVYWNKRESIFFGFHSSQEFYPISGGYLKENKCPGGYVAFMKWNGDDIRQYRLNVCQGCPRQLRTGNNGGAGRPGQEDPDPIKRGVK